MTFKELLKKQLLEESGNFYTDNYDYNTHPEKLKTKKKIINFFKRIVFSKAIMPLFLELGGYNFLLKQLGFYNYMEKLDSMYKRLASDESKELLLKLMAFRMLGYLKVKLPLNTPEYWQGIDKMKSIAQQDNFIEVPYKPYKLFYHDLNEIGFPVKIYLHSIALFTTFTVNHYRKTVNSSKVIQAQEGDVVLDLGGCYGDTGIYFADKVGEKGKVYTFEFIPSNKEILRKNLQLNLNLKDRIVLVENPLWDKSGIEVFYKDRGASSQVSFENSASLDGKVETVNIDDFVSKNNLPSVDFIKTDIEGAEPYAINGAIETIKKFKPKLAISIYHNMDDFTGIINQIDDLNLGYKFYINHATIYSSETVLFCEVE